VTVDCLVGLARILLHQVCFLVVVKQSQLHLPEGGAHALQLHGLRPVRALVIGHGAVGLLPQRHLHDGRGGEECAAREGRVTLGKAGLHLGVCTWATAPGRPRLAAPWVSNEGRCYCYCYSEYTTSQERTTLLSGRWYHATALAKPRLPSTGTKSTRSCGKGKLCGRTPPSSQHTAQFAAGCSSQFECLSPAAGRPPTSSA
jgi:hypothetical protein